MEFTVRLSVGKAFFAIGAGQARCFSFFFLGGLDFDDAFSNLDDGWIFVEKRKFKRFFSKASSY